MNKDSSILPENIYHITCIAQIDLMLQDTFHSLRLLMKLDFDVETKIL